MSHTTVSYRVEYEVDGRWYEYATSGDLAAAHVHAARITVHPARVVKVTTVATEEVVSA